MNDFTISNFLDSLQKEQKDLMENLKKDIPVKDKKKLNEKLTSITKTMESVVKLSQTYQK